MIVSTATHVAIVLLLVVGSGHVSDVLDRIDQTLTFLIPPDKAPPPVETKLSFASIGGRRDTPGTESRVRRESPDGRINKLEIAGAMTVGDQSSPAVQTDSPDNAYSVVEVDSMATVDINSAAPSYPKALMEKGIEGYATMRFVVDSTGSIDLGTVQPLDATHPEFVTAVREAMPRMRFRPAKMGDRPVRQLAEQLFKFQIQRTVPATAAPVPPPAAKKP
jgi:protein TonB